MAIYCIKRITFATFILLSLACNESGNTGSDGGDTTTTSRSGTENRGGDFVADVLEINAEEKAWLREAISSGTDEELKSTAQQMMKEHEKMEMDLRAYANKRNIRTDDMDTSEAVKINEKPGVDWDEEWADEVGDMHKQLIRRFERAERRIDDAELKNIINEGLPTLRTHLATLQKLEERLDRSNVYPNTNVDPVVK